ncbi:DnaJ-like protein [Rhizobium sp. PP-WC-2G-219]|nr:DnaJ-like protein [Rhizobium sp. PP-WC-2G-219]
MKNPYDVLGVAPSASEDDIRKAFRRLAKTCHPDLNPGNSQAEERFKDLSLANEIISDPEKRKRFDAGEIDASGADRPRQQYYKDYASDRSRAGHPYENASGFSDFSGAEDIFAGMFGRGARQPRRTRGSDMNYKLTIDFLEAINGGKKRISLPDGGSLDLAIPPGIEPGKVLRLRGKGSPAGGQGEAGDALVEISVAPHAYFVRHANDIHMTLPVTISEAALGARIKVPTPSGSVMLTVPKGSNSGTVVRLKGKGVPAQGKPGDQLITFQVMLPTKADTALDAFLANWTPGPDYDPRKDMDL